MKRKAQRAPEVPSTFSLGHGLFGPVVTASRHAPERLPSIAVLPFVTLAGADTVIDDAITDDLITHLSTIPQMRVIGRSTMFTYKGSAPDPRAVGRELEVGHVVAGTVRWPPSASSSTWSSWTRATARSNGPSESRCRKPTGCPRRTPSRRESAQLEPRADGRREPGAPAHRRLRLACAGPCHARVGGAVQQAANGGKQPIGIALAERGACHRCKAGIGLDRARLRGLPRRLVRLGRARSLVDGYRHAVELAERAIDLDPRAAEAYYAVGQSLNGLDELERAQAAHETCIALNPSHAPAYAALGQTRMFLGHPEETAVLCDRAFLFSPREPLRAIWHRSKGLAALFLDDPASAVASAQAAIALNAKYPSAYVVLAAAAMRLGQRALAESAVATLKTMPRFGTVAEVRAYQARPRRERFSRMLEALLADLHAAGLPLG